jgi:putative glutamine amidotransferase
MKIGVTDTMESEHKFKKYIEWLTNTHPEAECVVLSYKEDNLKLVDECDALLLTGGHDVDPGLYGGMVNHPKIIDVDRMRDDFETKALERALNADLPVLGVCRGLQLTNVVFGGTLIADIEEAGYHNHRSEKEAERRHDLIAERESMLYDITGRISGTINSSHHQAVLLPGKGLKVSARSEDGVIEALEYHEPDKHQFLLLVQWHPERMYDRESRFARKIAEAFLTAVKLAKQ